MLPRAGRGTLLALALWLVSGSGLLAETIGQRLATDLTWSQVQRDQRFPHMDRVFPVHRVSRGSVPVRSLLPASTLRLPAGVLSTYMQQQHLAGALVLEGDRIRLERYALGAGPATRWTGFSMTKSVTDTLVGVALQRGQIHSLDDRLSLYLPELRQSAYQDVTVRQLMTMTSGVRWDEDYTNAASDVARLYSTPVPTGVDSTIAYMRGLPRAVPAGTRWQYNTGETDLLGVLLRRVTGDSLAKLLSDSLWSRAGMEHDATWIATASNSSGKEFGGSGLSATLRDWGRLGLWAMEGGHGAVAPEWFPEATRAQASVGTTAYGYGWWPQGGAHLDGSFAALGIFGQSIFVDPARHLVIVSVGDWPEPLSPACSADRAAFWHQVQNAIDQENMAPSREAIFP